ncbi:MAG: DUF4349 domain-containing protein [Paucibacter sp.]|nr:DUF4349 domain-containing protein [Roseateles sp.]
MIPVRVWMLFALAFALSTTACGRKAENAAAPLQAQLAADSAMREAGAPERLLSYKHHLEVEVPAGQVEVGLKALQAACQAVPAQGCLVMQSSQSQGLRGDILMSVRRQAVDGLRTQAVGFGKLLSQGTRAEDLTGPITDLARRLAMHKALREDLLELRKQSRANIDSLMKVTEKLAEVQASIEAGEGELATLRSRVAMDELNVSLTIEPRAFVDKRHPVSDALSSFASNLAQGLGALIEFLALAAPWLVLLVLLPFVWRGLRRIWKLGRR